VVLLAIVVVHARCEIVLVGNMIYSSCSNDEQYTCTLGSGQLPESALVVEAVINIFSIKKAVQKKKINVVFAQKYSSLITKSNKHKQKQSGKLTD
jgi:hypothetical protein